MIPEFYEDSEIFVTGGSGVVGKALIEKLLRSCNVRKIYMLIRPKKNATIEERMQKLKKAMIFRRLHKEKPNEFDEKIQPIPGDAIEPMLGITSEYAKLMTNVSVVFHSAATVRFDEPLRDALTLNVGGTLETLKFAQTLTNLRSFLYVSTFFSNPYLEYLEPKFYKSPMDWKFCLDLTKRTDIPEELIEAITKKLIVGFPNTYCFTKNLAESLVNDYRDKLPVAIYRPSIVVFALEDPEPGFAPSLMGAMGLFAITGAGILKNLHIAKNQRLNLSPQDIAIKTMIHYACKTAEIYDHGRPSEIPVFLVSSSKYSPITFREYIRITQDYGFWTDAAYEKNFLIPGIICTDNKLLYDIMVFTRQIIPSLLVDLLLRLCGREPIMIKTQRKIYSTLEVMRPFLFNNYESPDITCISEMEKLYDGTDFDMSILRGSKNYYCHVGFCHDMVYSVREVLLKEDPSTLPRARRIMTLKIIAYRLVQLFLAYKLYHIIAPNITNFRWSMDYNRDLMMDQH